MTRLGFYDKMRERLFKQISSYFTSANSEITDDYKLTISLPESVVNAELQRIFTVKIEPDEVIEPNQIVAWRRREGLENPIDCLIMFDYDGQETQNVVYVRTSQIFDLDLTRIAGGEFNGKNKITPEGMRNGWVSGFPYKAEITYSEPRTLNFSRRGFLQ